MLNKLIKFCRDIAREKFEAFVVLRDVSSLNINNIKAMPTDPKFGYFWAKQWEERGFDSNHLEADFPLLYIERGTRTLKDGAVHDSIYIGLAISTKAELELNDTESDPTRSYLFENLSSVILTILNSKLVVTPDGEELVPECEDGFERADCDLIIINQDEIELVWTDTATEGINAVSAELVIKTSANQYCFQRKSPLAIEIKGIASCCD